MAALSPFADGAARKISMASPKRRQRAGDGRAVAVCGLRRQEDFDGFFKAATEEVIIAAEWNRRLGADARFEGQVEAVDRVKEEESADTFVEIVAGAAETVEGGGFALQLCEGGGAAKGVEREVANGRVGRGDDAGELAHCAGYLPAAGISRMASRSEERRVGKECR